MRRMTARRVLRHEPSSIHTVRLSAVRDPWPVAVAMGAAWQAADTGIFDLAREWDESDSRLKKEAGLGLCFWKDRWVPHDKASDSYALSCIPSHFTGRGR